jgi:hypothetical protein
LYGADLVNEIAYIDGCATVGLSMNFLNLIKLGLGVGPYFGAKEQDNGWVMLYVILRIKVLPLMCSKCSNIPHCTTGRMPTCV